MSKTSRVLPAILTLAVFAALGGWFWSRDQDGDVSDAEQIAQFKGDGPSAKTPPRPRPPLVWKDATPAERKAAQSSIVAQLEAFKHGDWNKAVSYQSSGLRSNFGSVEEFQQIIEKNYPQFANYRKIEFLTAKSSGPTMNLTVKLTGSDGVKISAMYLMIKESGIYRVAGVSGGEAGGEEPGNLI